MFRNGPEMDGGDTAYLGPTTIIEMTIPRSQSSSAATLDDSGVLAGPITVHFIVPTYLYYILFYVYYILKKKKKSFVVLFCINLDGGFVEFSDFVARLIPTKVCGTIGDEVTFLPLETFTGV